MIVNGKEYPMWSQFVEKKDEWIGGILSDFGDSFDRRMGISPMETIIIDVVLEPNGDDSAFFMVKGENFECGFDVQHGGIGGNQEDGWINFSGYGGHSWKIKKKGE